MGNDDTMDEQITTLEGISEKDEELASNTLVMPDASVVSIKGNSELDNIRAIKESHARVLTPELNEKGFKIPNAAMSPMMIYDIPADGGSSVNRCEVSMHVLPKCTMSRKIDGKRGIEDPSMICLEVTRIEECELPAQDTWELCKEDKRKTKKKAALQATRQSSRLKIHGGISV
jgi:hypothetical protein